MQSIVYIIPYFGKLPQNMILILESMRYNPDVNWIIYTDDKTEYDYPKNVKVVYTTFDRIVERCKSIYNFDICLNKVYKICDFKVAYGEIFQDDIKDYDFWGYCDLDMMFGKIRDFIKDDMLEKYDKIGYQGHSTLFRNNEKNNRIYREEVEGTVSYREVFSNEKIYCFDETVITEKYSKLKIEQFLETNFAHLGKFESGFYLRHLKPEDDYKNKNQIFVWEDGNLLRYYIHEKKVYIEKFMYIHFWCRPMTYSNFKSNSYLIYADAVKPNPYKEITVKIVKKHSKNRKIVFYFKMLKKNRKKITFKRIIKNLKIKKILKKNNYQ